MTGGGPEGRPNHVALVPGQRLHSLKSFRAIATRLEKTGRNFLALVQVACAWLRLES